MIEENIKEALREENYEFLKSLTRLRKEIEGGKEKREMPFICTGSVCNILPSSVLKELGKTCEDCPDWEEFTRLSEKFVKKCPVYIEGKKYEKLERR